jgi:hypothetical protein
MRYLLLCLMLCACGRDVTAPTASVPANAVRFQPSAFERTALATVRACIAANGSTPNSTAVDDLAWYTVSGPSFTIGGAIWQGYAGHGWIVLATDAPDKEQLTEHELAHQLVVEVVPHSSPFWAKCNLLQGYGTTFTIPTP